MHLVHPHFVLFLLFFTIDVSLCGYFSRTLCSLYDIRFFFSHPPPPLCLLTHPANQLPAWYKCTHTECQQSSKPCHCARFEPPKMLDKNEIPQFVLITHDDAVRLRVCVPPFLFYTHTHSQPSTFNHKQTNRLTNSQFAI